MKFGKFSPLAASKRRGTQAASAPSARGADFSAQLQGVARQFENLDRRDPSRWPIVPQVLLCIVVVVATVALAWYVHLDPKIQSLHTERQTEQTLQQEYRQKLAKAVNLEALKQQRAQVQRYVAQIEKQLPSQAEIAAVLYDVNAAGVGRNLQFETFRPGAEQRRDYYVELPITVRLAGTFDDLGAFMADLARLPRIVTLSNMTLEPSNRASNSSAPTAATGSAQPLVLNATVHTFRYLNDEEGAAAAAANPNKMPGNNLGPN